MSDTVRYSGRYKADLAGGSLKVAESRVVAALLLEGVTAEAWTDVIVHRNVLQKRSQHTAARQASLIRARLVTMDSPLWRMVAEAPTALATQAVMAAAVKHSPLLADFLNSCYREQVRLFQPTLPHSLWFEFLDQCAARDPLMPLWSDSTTAKLRENVFRILAECGYIEDTRRMKLQRVRLLPELVSYLRDSRNDAVLRCLDTTL